MREALVGHRLLQSDFRVPQYAEVDLSGQTVTAFEAVGKHLLTRFSGGLTLHTHLLMDGSWRATGPGKELPATFRDEIRVALRTEAATGWALRMQVVDLLPTTDEATVVGHLGPDLLGAWDAEEALRRLQREPDRPVLEAILDQKNLSGLGNLWVNEVCFLRGVSPWTPVGEVDLPRLLALARKMITHGLEHGGMVTTGDTRRGMTHWVYGRAGRPCRRCGTPVDYRDLVAGEPYSREVWWCPRCQPGPFPSLEERPSRPGARRGVNEESYGSRTRRLNGAPGLARKRRL
jgi:formamidopyrimidine-DNA glycosylase